MIYVLDQNFMRSEELRIQVQSADSQFVILDGAFEEMTKSPKWEDTIRASFEILAPVLDRVLFTAGVGEMLRYEQKTNVPVSLEIISPADLNFAYRRFIKTILARADGAAELRSAVIKTREAMAGERQDGLTIKAAMLAQVDQLKRLNGPDLTKEIRSRRMSAEARLGLILVRAEKMTDQFSELNEPDTPPLGFMTTRCVTAMLWYYDDWLATGGLHDAKPQLLANDEFDLEYAVVASYFDGLLSKDTRAVRCAADLRLITSPVTGPGLVDAALQYAKDTGRIPPTVGELTD